MPLFKFEEAFYLLHEGIEKLISIALHHGIDRDSFVCYERFAEFLCCDAFPYAELEGGEDMLKLIYFILFEVGLVGFALNR